MLTASGGRKSASSPRRILDRRDAATCAQFERGLGARFETFELPKSGTSVTESRGDVGQSRPCNRCPRCANTSGDVFFGTDVQYWVVSLAQVVALFNKNPELCTKQSTGYVSISAVRLPFKPRNDPTDRNKMISACSSGMLVVAKKFQCLSVASAKWVAPA